MQTKMQAPPLRNGSCGGKQVTLNHKPTRHSFQLCIVLKKLPYIYIYGRLPAVKIFFQSIICRGYSRVACLNAGIYFFLISPFPQTFIFFQKPFHWIPPKLTYMDHNIWHFFVLPDCVPACCSTNLDRMLKTARQETTYYRKRDRNNVRGSLICSPKMIKTNHSRKGPQEATEAFPQWVVFLSLFPCTPSIDCHN